MSASNGKIRGFLQTGQKTCHDTDGVIIDCSHSGQDAEFHSGLAWPSPRFKTNNEIVLDKLTGLYWPVNANLAEFPLDWNEALGFIAEMNTAASLGFHDWRLPNRRELRSLICHQSRRPALPADHPFANVFPHWYWSSTSTVAHPDHAWYINMDGGRMFYGGKDQAFMLWPVRGPGSEILAATGQQSCFDISGKPADCKNSGQDGEWRNGLEWPEPRFEMIASYMRDRLTGLVWLAKAGLSQEPVTWRKALQSIDRLNQTDSSRFWRLPNINELESLVDCSKTSPALPAAHPFGSTGKVYWSSTTSLYEPDWAWALYIEDGAVGVGQKGFAHFEVFAVSDDDSSLRFTNV